MMKKIRIISIRKNTNSQIQVLEKEYVKRLSSQFSIEFKDMRQTYASKESVESILKKERGLLLPELDNASFTIALDAKGKSFSSEGFSEWISKLHNDRSYKTLQFVIGGAYGLHSDVLGQSHANLSLSSMTYPHELVRLILCEQLYRAMDIATCGNYHK